jgi:hypothetical protein
MADMDLADFVKARLDEDEDYVRTMFDVVKRQEAKAAEMSDSDLAKLMPAVMGLLAAEPAIPAISAQWAARGTKPPNDLNRVLREVEAGRQLLSAYEDAVDWLSAAEDDDSDIFSDDERPAKVQWHGGVVEALTAALAIRAAVWGDHPDYDPSWRPEA